MYLAAFLFPVLIVAGIYIAGGVWPFGEECFLKTDMYHQYAPFFSEFRHKLRTGGSLLYSYDVGLGVNFLAVIAYYLASPMNLFVALCPENHVIEFMNILMIVKLGLTSLSFTYYLRKHFGREDAGFSFFGMTYALSGYMCAYYWNLMWLSVIMLFPLVILSLEILVRKGRVFPYAVLLGLSIWTNYYISIMVCLFLVIWYIALCVLYLPKNGKEFLIRSSKFAAGSIAAGLFAGILLIPAWFALGLSASATSTFPTTVKEYFPVIDVLARMLPAVTTEQALEHWPNIYAGTFALLLIPLYLVNERISVREKSVYLFVVLLLIGSFSYNFLEYIWHGLHFPNSLPAREAFAFDFLVIFMCARVYTLRRAVTASQAGAALLSAFIFLLYVQKDADSKYFPVYTFWLSLLLVALYALGILLYKNRKLPERGAVLFLMAVLLCDLTVNSAVTSFTTCSRTYYVKDNEDIRELYRETEDLREDGDLYRFERITRRTKDDGAWLNYPSVSLFSSTADAGLSDFFKKVGCEASTNAYSITGSTPLIDSLLNIRYGFYSGELPLSLGKKLIDVTETTCLYENVNHTSLGFMIPKTFTMPWIFEFDNPVLVQNSLCDVLGVPQVMEEITIGAMEPDKSYSIYVPTDGEYYVYVGNTSVKKATVTTDGTKKEYSNLDRKYLIELGELLQDDYVKITPDNDEKDMKLKLYRVNYDALAEFAAVLREEPLNITKISDTRIRGTVTSEADNRELFISLPYDEGWTCTVDGRETPIHEGFGEAFMGIPVRKGTHEICLTYVPKGLREGIFATLAGVMLMGLLFLADRKNKKDFRA